MTARLFDQIEWDENPGASEGAPSTMTKGVRRKWLVPGEAGFHIQIVEMPAGHIVEPHSHTASEVIIVLAGGLELDGGEHLAAMDATVLEANQAYGFKVGPHGVRFFIVRSQVATMNVG